MIVLVCGGRDYSDRTRLYRLLDFNRAKITGIVHGAARGADCLAADWAYSRGVPLTAYRADWKKYGKLAGLLRNHRMLAEAKPDLVVGFPGGRGTAHMMGIAREAGVRVIDVAVEDAPDHQSQLALRLHDAASLPAPAGLR
jgi:hypothetical protein